MHRKPDYLKKETLYSFERIHSPRTIKYLEENDQELMHDIRVEHKIGIHVTLVYHPYKLIYYAEQVPIIMKPVVAGVSV